MQLKKAILTGSAAAVLVGSVLNVSAAKITAADYVDVLKADEKENLILDVDAYRAAYSDLAAAFGDDTDAYIEHYLTIGVYEGRTRGVLFDPLAYAQAYPDVMQACGDDISAIVDHYVNFGVTENRTLGTAGGYTDIAEAQKNGARRRSVPANGARVNAPAISPAAVNAGVAADGNSPASSSADGGYTLNAPAGSYGNTDASASAASSYSASAPAANSASASAASSAPAAPAPAPSTDSSQSYHHTTSIYTNDESTLLRVEYYDDNNKLFEYSSVSDYDKDTGSYTETVYGVDNEPVRTDTYVNGELASSQKH